MIVEINESNVEAFPYELVGNRCLVEERKVYGSDYEQIMDVQVYLANLTAIVLHEKPPFEVGTMHKSDINFIRDSLEFGGRLISLLKYSKNVTLNTEKDIEMYRAFMSCCEAVRCNNYGAFRI